MSVKPMQVVTKLGRSMVTEFKGPVTWLYDDCVTLADAERFAKESVEEAKAVIPPPGFFGTEEQLRACQRVARDEEFKRHEELIQGLKRVWNETCERVAELEKSEKKVQECVAALLYDSPRLELRVERLERGALLDHGFSEPTEKSK